MRRSQTARPSRGFGLTRPLRVLSTVAILSALAPTGHAAQGSTTASSVQPKASLPAIAPRPGARATDTVVLVRVDDPDAGWPEAERRLEAELRALGLNVVVVPPSRAQPGHALDATESALAWLDQLAEPHAAVAIVRLERGGTRKADETTVTVWVTDRLTRKMNVRRFEIDARKTPRPEVDAGLRAVELLNASLLELEANHFAARQPTVSPRVRKLVTSTLRGDGQHIRGGLHLGVHAGGSSRTAGATAGILVGGSYAPHAVVRLEGELLATTLPFRVTDPTGRTLAGLVLPRAHLHLVAFARRRVSFSVGLGGGALAVWTRGIPSQAHYEGRTDVATAGLASAAVNLRVRLHRRLALRCDFHAAATWPEITIRHAGVPVATLGRPLLDGSLAIEWLWPWTARRR